MHTPSSSPYQHPTWSIGAGISDNWLGQSEQYHVNCHEQSGIILGGASKTRFETLLRLACNAASMKWKVFFIDAQGSQERAASFYASMQQAGQQYVHIFPTDPYAGWQGSGKTLFHRLLQTVPGSSKHATTAGLTHILDETNYTPMYTAYELKKRIKEQGFKSSIHHQYPTNHCLTRYQVADLALHYEAFTSLVGTSFDGSWTFDFADAAYFSLQAWSSPDEAQAQAQFLLTDLSRYLVECAEHQESTTPVLLLIHHPELLFDLDQHIAPLFSHMQQAHGSLFLAARSPNDFGRTASHLLRNASMLLLHQSMTGWPFETYAPLPWWKTNVLRDGTLQRLQNAECLALANGQIHHVLIQPPPIDTAAIGQATRFLTSQAFAKEQEYPVFRPHHKPHDSSMSMKEQIQEHPSSPDQTEQVQETIEQTTEALHLSSANRS